MEPDCKICGNRANNRRFVLREMQLGLRDEFPYFQCARCGCVQIERVPDDLGRYYPSNYYSLSADLDHPRSLAARLFFRTVQLLGPLVRFFLLDQGPCGRLARRFLAWLDLRLLILDVVSRTGVGKRSAILDVGSGSGFIPFCLKQIGFENVLGIDPFLKHDLVYRNGLRIRQTDLFGLLESTDERFDLIMFNHSLEHVPEQEATLAAAARLLRDAGLILVRIPVADCYAFERYGPHFVSLDAPRHLFIHTRASMERVAAQAGLVVEQTMCDSNESQFWVSEQYAQDIPLESPQSYRHNRRRSIFSANQIRQFRKLARELNRSGRGDWLALFLRKRPVTAPTVLPAGAAFQEHQS